MMKTRRKFPRSQLDQNLCSEISAAARPAAGRAAPLLVKCRAFFVLAALLCAGTPISRAATFNIANGDVAGLIAAINTCNSNGQDDTINLVPGGTYVFTAVNNTTYGPSATPLIIHDGTGGTFHNITINANASTIMRSTAAGTPNFRLFTLYSLAAPGYAVTINSATLKNGQAGADYGGAFYGNDNLVLNDCTLEGNAATRGGAIAWDVRSLQLNRCTLNNNQAVEVGGAIHNNSGEPKLDNCTFAGNTSASGGTPDAIYTLGYTQVATTEIINCTVVDGRIANVLLPNFPSTYQAHTSIGSTILKNAPFFISPSNSQYSTIVSSGYNISTGSGQNVLTAAGDQINTDPMLDPAGLKDWGGATKTIALVNGPAVDHGKRFSSLTTDQRGVQRTYDHPYVNNGPGTDGTDVGAFEGAPDVLQTGSPQFNVTSVQDGDDGMCGIVDCSLREAINRANFTAGSNTILFLVGGTITLSSNLGPLTVTDPLTLAGFGARSTIISGASQTGVFNFSGGPHFLLGLTIRNGTVVTGPGVTAMGAGLLNTGTLTVHECMFLNHQLIAGSGVSAGSNGGAAQGAGVYNGGTLTLNRCTIAANNANAGSGATNSGLNSGGSGGAAQGSGGFNNSGATLTMTNCTIANNNARGGTGGNDSNGFGGNGGGGEAGVFNAGTLSLTGCTIASNTGIGGNGGTGSSTPYNGAPGSSIGGLERNAGTATIANTLVALNTGNAGPDVSGAFSSQGYNFIGKGDFGSGFNSMGDRVGTIASPFNPNLGPLQNNGGKTDTMALLNPSPAIDAGNSFGLTVDQRYQARPNDHPLIGNAPGGDGADIGAFEYGEVLLVNTLTDHSDGTCDAVDCTLREAIAAANAQTGENFIKFDPALTATNPGTIQLIGALPSISGQTYLQGPGANRLTVRRDIGGDYRIFNIGNGTANGPFVGIYGLTIANGKVGTQTVPESGAGILVDRSVLDLEYCALTGNNANTHGGAVLISQRNTNEFSQIFNCTFNGNNSTGGSGGGLCVNSAAAMVMNCTFSGNSAINGGAIYAGQVNSSFLPEVVVDSSTLSGNVATNPSSTGGGIGKDNGNLHVLHNIFHNNSGGSLYTFVVASPPFSHGHNLASDNGRGYLTSQGDIINTDPRLDPGGLRNNAGPTQTIALLADSPAINASDEGSPPLDQRGYIRNGTPDIGAFEFWNDLVPISAVSRKTHGTAGTFDFNLPLTGPVGTECRAGPYHQVILTFPIAVTVAGVTATPDPSATPAASGSVWDFSVDGSQVTVNLTGVSNAQRLGITLSNVSDGANTNIAFTFPIGILAGDTTGDGSVNSADISQTKSKSGQAVGSSNYRNDVTLDGSLNSADISLVKSKSGTALP